MSLEEFETQLRPVFLAALAGDAVAYRRFLDAIGGRLRGYLRQMLARAGRHEPSEAEDVLQEVLLALHLSRHTYDPASPVTAWAHAIARYKLVDHLRRSGRHAGNLPLDDEAFQLADRPEAPSTEARLDLDRAMASLPERTRGLIDRVRLQGASVAEAADAAGMTENAAKVAIHRGLQAMAKFLSRRGERPT
ncbi:sigma-70 family RNA polymerase sigma factor [Bosea sp. SSUT16]|uniref:Sigma-70 family RNA polymerase sigma factor n=1 Tax=Bosea spartocytisi TaxID=2773451 RepID=A0A927I1Q6_9HYPH|nr:sigma-70 family RNA polymerase sigma factor [Bosea spartocytisi]MBD3847647.1 sigma-70 family RNA polymerase sigma factor [Bosea spartocytisi]MCT4472187.1 sigma-70 family RNA polymerase sigma factor [Bosea spartocytisi]